MSVQTSYDRLIDPRIHGSLNDLNENEVQSGAAEAAIGFGIAVKRGTNERQVDVASDADFLGIAVRELGLEGAANSAVISYAEGDDVSVLRSGRINLTCPTGCSPGDVANYVDATGAIDAGAAGAGETLIGGATWETTTAAGEVGILRLPDNVTIA